MHIQKEASVDTDLSQALDSLGDELTSLNNQKNIAAQNRDYNYKKYLEELKREAQSKINLLRGK